MLDPKLYQHKTPNRMGRSTWAAKLQALLLSNCTLRYLMLMAVAQMKTSMANAVRSKSALSVSGPGALSVRAQRSLSGPGGLCRGRHSRRSLSGPGGPIFTLCASARRSLCRRFLCRAPALCVSTRRCLCQGPALSACSLCRGPALSVGVCVGARHSLCRALAVSVSVPGPALFVPGPDSVSGARSPLPTLSVRLLVSVSGSLRGPALSVSGQALARRSPALSVSEPARAPAVLRRHPALSVGVRRSVSGPGALFVGPRLSLCRGPALPVSRAPSSDL